MENDWGTQTHGTPRLLRRSRAGHEASCLWAQRKSRPSSLSQQEEGRAHLHCALQLGAEPPSLRSAASRPRADGRDSALTQTGQAVARGWQVGPRFSPTHPAGRPPVALRSKKACQPQHPGVAAGTHT